MGHFNVFHHREHYGLIWYVIHQDAAFATTQQLKEAYVANINNRAQRFPCDECRLEFIAYLRDNGLHLPGQQHYWNMIDSEGNDIGFFEWSRNFHNAVNKRIGKRTYSHKETYSYYRFGQSTVPRLGPTVPKDLKEEKPCPACQAKKRFPTYERRIIYE
jgi:hypothetical protein